MQASKSIDKNKSETQLISDQENYGQTCNFEIKNENSAMKNIRLREETMSMTNLLSLEPISARREIINTPNGIQIVKSDYENDVKGMCTYNFEKSLELSRSSSQIQKRNKETYMDNICKMDEDLLTMCVSDALSNDDMSENILNLESPIVLNSLSNITNQILTYGSSTHHFQNPNASSGSILKSALSMFNASTTVKLVSDQNLKQKMFDPVKKENEAFSQKNTAALHSTPAHVEHKKVLAHKKKRKHYRQAKLRCDCLLLIGFVLVFKRLRKLLLGECRNKSKMDFLNPNFSTKLL